MWNGDGLDPGTSSPPAPPFSSSLGLDLIYVGEMLSEKPWKLDVVVRLLMRMAICFCSIWFVMGLVQRFQGDGKPDENSPLYLLALTLSMQGSILLVVAITLHQERISWA